MRAAAVTATRLGSVLLLVAAWTVLAVVGATAATRTITIGDGVDPSTLEVSPGTTVTWHNTDDTRHRIRSRDGAEEFDTGDLDPGETVSIVLTVVGAYPYADERDRDDPAYHGTITVRSAGAGGGDGGGSGGAPRASSGDGGDATGQVTVGILDRSFSPARISVASGATVRWDNRSDREHTVTLRDGGGSDVLGGGASYEHTFPEPGTFAYLCAIHPEMTGTVVVAGGGGATAGPAPSAEARSGAGRGSQAPGAADPSAATRPGAASVTIADLAYAPATVTVTPGTTVTWRNTDAFAHTVTGRGFDSGSLAAEATFRRRFDEPGRFAYRCTLHPQMTGTIVVAAAAPATAPEPTGSPDPPTEPPTSATAPPADPSAATASGTDPRVPRPPVLPVLGALVAGLVGGAAAGRAWAH